MGRQTGVNGLVKTATNMIAQVPGGERLVLQAVKDLLDELRDVRKLNARLQKENEQLTVRLEKLRNAKTRA